MINELANILEQEARVYDSILNISRNKTKIIVEGKVTELENIVKLEQSLVLQIGRLENLREEIVEKCAEQLGVNPSDITVSELVKHLKGDHAKKLKASQQKMASTLSDLKNTNDLNSKLIKNSLDFINFSINLFVDAGAGSNNYGSTGQAADTSKRSFFDVKL